MNKYMEGKIARLERYLSTGVFIELALGPRSTQLSIKNQKHTYNFSDEGWDLFEAFSKVLECASRTLRYDHQRFHRTPLNELRSS